MDKQPPQPGKANVPGSKGFVEQRKSERRKSNDRREGVRFEIGKSERRKKGPGSNRRKGNAWG